MIIGLFLFLSTMSSVAEVNVQLTYESDTEGPYLLSMDFNEIKAAAAHNSCLRELLPIAESGSLKATSISGEWKKLERLEGSFTLVMNVHETAGLQLFARREANSTLGQERVELNRAPAPSSACASERLAEFQRMIPELIRRLPPSEGSGAGGLENLLRELSGDGESAGDLVHCP